MISYFYHCVFFAFIALNGVLGDECDASDSYVEIVTPKSLEGTLLSAPVSFPPDTYSPISATEVVVLTSEENNGCVDDPEDITTDVFNKIVFIWIGTNCTEKVKVLNLEKNGAVAVLLANDEGEDVVQTIRTDTVSGNHDRRRARTRRLLEDLDDSDPIIPAREIDEEDGWIIVNYLESLEDITNINENNTLTVEINCFDDGYSSSICVMDGTGDYWYMDGEFEQQATDIESNLFNNLPIFKKEGYLGMTNDLYMFASDSSEYYDLYNSTNNSTSNSSSSSNDGSDGFGYRWVISWSVSDDMIDVVAFCEEFTSDPGDCNNWQVSDDDSETGYSRNEYIYVDDELCEVEESYVCLQSDDYQLSGLQGTYQLITEATGLWIRDPTETDLTPGYLVYGYTSRYTYHGIIKQYGFFLVDTVDQKFPAYCILGTEYNATEEFMPYLCTSWKVVPDSTTNDYQYDTVNEQIASDGVCDDYSASDATSTVDSDALKNHSFVCVGNHTMRHAFLQGEYKKIPGETTSSGRSVWHFMDGTSQYDAYIFYYGDLNDDILWWVISVDPPTQDAPRVYAYCPAMTEHPSDCDACWFFYFNGDWDPDCETYVKRGLCDATTTSLPPEPTVPLSKATTATPDTTHITVQSMTSTLATSLTTTMASQGAAATTAAAETATTATASSAYLTTNSASTTQITAPIVTKPLPTTTQGHVMLTTPGGSNAAFGGSGSDNSHNSNGTLLTTTNLEIIAIIVGATLIICVMLLVFCCYMKKRKSVQVGFYGNGGMAANDNIEMQHATMSNQIVTAESDNEDNMANVVDPVDSTMNGMAGDGTLETGVTAMGSDMINVGNIEKGGKIKGNDDEIALPADVDGADTGGNRRKFGKSKNAKKNVTYEQLR